MTAKQKGCFQKQTIEVEAENSLAVINKRILEIKKKIQLSGILYAFKSRI